MTTKTLFTTVLSIVTLALSTTCVAAQDYDLLILNPFSGERQ